MTSSGRVREYRASIWRRSQDLIPFLLLGTSRINPIVSVKKPGVSNTSPATPINKASSSSPEGILPSRRLSWIRNKVCNPCIRAKYAPKKPVKMKRAFEVSAPNTVQFFISS